MCSWWCGHGGRISEISYLPFQFYLVSEVRRVRDQSLPYFHPSLKPSWGRGAGQEEDSWEGTGAAETETAGAGAADGSTTEESPGKHSPADREAGEGKRKPTERAQYDVGAQAEGRSGCGLSSAWRSLPLYIRKGWVKVTARLWREAPLPFTACDILKSWSLWILPKSLWILLYK